MSTDLKQLNRPGRRSIEDRSKYANLLRRAQSAGLLRAHRSRHRHKPLHKHYKKHLSHKTYSQAALKWDSRPEWELQSPDELKLKHKAHRDVRSVWRQRNLADHDPIQSYNKVVEHGLHIKPSKKKKKLKNPYKQQGLKLNSAEQAVKYLRPGPIFSRVHIASSNATNRSVVHKEEQIVIAIETRLRTQRPTVILWPSQFYKQWRLDKRHKRSMGSKNKHDMLINRHNKRKQIIFQNTFTSSYLFNVEKDSNLVYIPKQYDVEVSVCEEAIGSKKWKAVFNINSHHFQNGIVPFTVSVSQVSRNPALHSKVYVTNMTTDNSYVILKCKGSGHRRRKRAKKKQTSKRKKGTHSGKAKRKRRPKTRRAQRRDTVAAGNNPPQLDRQIGANQGDIERSLVDEYKKLKGSIADIQSILYKTDVLNDKTGYTQLQRNFAEKQIVYMIKNQIKDFDNLGPDYHY